MGGDRGNGRADDVAAQFRRRIGADLEAGLDARSYNRRIDAKG